MRGAPGRLSGADDVAGCSRCRGRAITLGAGASLRRVPSRTLRSRRGSGKCTRIRGRPTGSPRIHAELQEEGQRVGRKRVARLMRGARLEGASRRRFVKTTQRAEDARPAPDLVDRDFSVSGPDQLWVADITYVPTWAGFLYLAVVLDAWSRRVVGLGDGDASQDGAGAGCARHGALAAAAGGGDPSLRSGHAVHVDRVRPALQAGGREAVDGLGGRRVRQRDVRELLRHARVRACWSSAASAPRPRRDWRCSGFIEGWYNPRRRHSALGYQSPVNFERRAAHLAASPAESGSADCVYGHNKRRSRASECSTPPAPRGKLSSPRG